MPPPDLAEQRDAHDKKHFLQIDGLRTGITEMKPAGDLANDDDKGNGNGTPLQTQKDRGKKRGTVIQTIFELHLEMIFRFLQGLSLGPASI